MFTKVYRETLLIDSKEDLAICKYCFLLAFKDFEGANGAVYGGGSNAFIFEFKVRCSEKRYRKFTEALHKSHYVVIPYMNSVNYISHLKKI